MATALIMVCGRIGSVSGSSLVGVMLGYNCSLIFYFFGGMLISKCQMKIDRSYNLSKLSQLLLLFQLVL